MKIPHCRAGTWPERRVDRFASRIRGGEARGEPIALLGLPDELGVRMNGGRAGASQGPSAFRRALASFGTGWDGGEGRVLEIGVFDAGDVEPAEGEGEEALEETHSRVTEAARALHEAGMIVVAVGGGHDLTYPTVRALAEHAGSAVGGMNVDPHLDVRETAGSGMPYRALIEGGHVDAERFVEFGVGRWVNSREHVEYLTGKGSVLIGVERALAHPAAMNVAFERISRGMAEPAFVSVDLDVIDGSQAPGVSAVNPMGLPVELVGRMAWRAGAHPSVRHFDLMELSPRHDDYGGGDMGSGVGRTARVAALLFLQFLAGVQERAS
ncbi:MAG: formimidoylglutamase [Phycisphaerales bacterium]